MADAPQPSFCEISMKIENPNPIQWQFSQRAQQLQSSAIREILKITQRPEIISFAGGLPSPATFPVDVMKAAYAHAIRKGYRFYSYGDGSLLLPDPKIAAERA